MSFFRAGALALGVIAGFSLSPASAQQAKDPVVAVVNGKEIRKSAMVEAQQALPQLRQVPLEMVYDQLLEHLINSQLISAEAVKANMQNDSKVKARMKEIETRVLQEAYLAKRVESDLTDAAVRKKYDELMATAKPREEVRARHILVETEDAAKAVLSDLKAGAKFEDLAKAKSKDQGAAQNGGDLGYFGKEEMVPPFAEAAFSLKPGETTTAPVKTQFGWHVIKVEDRRTAQPPAFEQVRDQLKAQMADEAAMNVVKGLREKAQVKKFAIDGSPADAAPAKK
jgi:peptidyl-prolyl cis-trans isomerase C